MSEELDVYLDGVPVGTLTQNRHGALAFSYDEEYRASPAATPLSLSMPLSSGSHGNRVARAWMDGLLPDNDGVRRRWAMRQVTARDWARAASRLGLQADGAVERAKGLRAALSPALKRAIHRMSPPLRDRASIVADAIERHAAKLSNTWVAR